MDEVAPAGPVYQAGTLSGNPLAMAAGYALLSELNENPHYYDELEQKAATLANGLKQIFVNNQLPAAINRVGSMMSVFFTNDEVINFSTANTTDKEQFRRFFHGMLERGIYLPPSPFEAWFLAATLDESMIEQTIDAAAQILNKEQFH
jgi:glutamate-1-semialdehyde 2,1-aminomutase